jgi:hypothetical protein
VFQLENANPNSLNSDKKKKVNHVLTYWEWGLNWGICNSRIGVLYGLFGKEYWLAKGQAGASH